MILNDLIPTKHETSLQSKLFNFWKPRKDCIEKFESLTITIRLPMSTIIISEGDV